MLSGERASDGEPEAGPVGLAGHARLECALADGRVEPDALVAAAERANVSHWIAALFAGEKINLSEHRPVLHTALRAPPSAEIFVDGTDMFFGNDQLPLVEAALKRTPR